MSYINSFFDKAYVINLERNSNRLSYFYEGYEKSCLPWKVERFNAIDGRQQSVPMWFRNGAGSGAYGCFLSHRTILQNALKDGLKNVLIFEDDCGFKDCSLDVISRAIEQLPEDWDFFYLGTEYHHRYSEIYYQDKIRYPMRITDNIVRCYNANRTHAYAVNGKAIQKVVDFLSEDTTHGRYGHIDHQYGVLHGRSDINCYVVYPLICYQRGGYSEITKSINRDCYWNIFMSFDEYKFAKISDFVVGYGKPGLNGSLGYDNKDVVLDGLSEEYEILSVHAPSNGCVEFLCDVELFGFISEDDTDDSYSEITAVCDETNLGCIKKRGSKTKPVVVPKGVHQLKFWANGRNYHSHSVWCWKPYKTEDLIKKEDNDKEENDLLCNNGFDSDTNNQTDNIANNEEKEVKDVDSKQDNVRRKKK